MTYRVTDEAWLDIKARALIKISDAKDLETRCKVVYDKEPDDWSDEDFADMESWARGVFSPLRDEDLSDSLERVKVAVMAAIGEDLD